MSSRERVLGGRVSPTLRIRGAMSPYVRACLERSQKARGTPGPINLALPTITGTTGIGDLLTCAPGAWTHYDTIAYQWERDGVAIGGAVAATHTITAADANADLTCVVTATNVAGATAAESESVNIPFDFADASGYYADFWAEAGITKNGSQQVTSWVDQETGITVTRAASAAVTYDPIGLGGRPAIVANGAGSLSAASVIKSSTIYTLYAWIDVDDTTTVSQCVMDSQTGRLIFCQTQVAGTDVGTYDGSGRSFGAATLGPQALIYETSGALCRVYRNGVALGAAQVANAIALGGGFGLLGNFAGSGGYAAAKLGRAVLYTAAHDADTKAAISALGNAYYGT
jgi:hypothetical protein